RKNLQAQLSSRNFRFKQAIKNIDNVENLLIDKRVRHTILQLVAANICNFNLLGTVVTSKYATCDTGLKCIQPASIRSNEKTRYRKRPTIYEFLLNSSALLKKLL
ncbi:hypothetical protein V1477_016532, partial [Vespula maculifrons]